MFDRTYMFGDRGPRYTSVTTTIKEERAATDESIRLYEEMKDKAEKSVLATIKVEDNPLNFKAAIWQDPASLRYICRAILTVNGEEIDIDWEIKDVYTLSKQELIRKVYEEASKTIAGELVGRMVQDNVNVFFRGK